jgi:hypothetical protein
MATMDTSEKIGLAGPVKIVAHDGVTEANVDGPIVWRSSDETVMTPAPDADGRNGFWVSVAPGTATPFLDADADLGQGILTITKQLEDITVTLFTPQAENFVVDLAAPVKK